MSNSGWPKYEPRNATNENGSEDHSARYPGPRSSSPRPSLATRLVSWLVKKIPFVSFRSAAQARGSTNGKKGAQHTVVSPSPCGGPGPITELAVATPEGLRAFIHNPNQTVSSSNQLKPMCAAVTVDTADSFESCAPTSLGVCYQSIKRDVTGIMRHLYKLGFWERILDKLASSSNWCLTDQVAAYLSRSSDDRSSRQIRWLVLSGHYSLNELTIDGTSRCRWRSVRQALQTPPAGVITVLVLACCYAEEVMETLLDGTENPQLVIMASSQSSEVSHADNRVGDHFMDALFTIFQDKTFRWGSSTWKDVVRRIKHELHRIGTIDQNPVVYASTQLAPSDICDALIEPSLSELPRPRGRNVGISQGPPLATS